MFNLRNCESCTIHTNYNSTNVDVVQMSFSLGSLVNFESVLLLVKTIKLIYNCDEV